MTELVIEKGIPIPPPAQMRARGYTYKVSLVIIKQLEVMDSVLFSDLSQNQIIPRLGYYKSEYGFKFATRAEGNGTRVWRIE